MQVHNPPPKGATILSFKTFQGFGTNDPITIARNSLTPLSSPSSGERCLGAFFIASRRSRSHNIVLRSRRGPTTEEAATHDDQPLLGRMTPDRQPLDPRGTIIDAQLGRGSISAGICQKLGKSGAERCALLCLRWW
jgi:hypothetical protein